MPKTPAQALAFGRRLFGALVLLCALTWTVTASLGQDRELNPIGTEETTVVNELSGPQESGVPLLESGALDDLGARRLQVTGRPGLAFRFFWFQVMNDDLPASVAEFRYPVGTAYPSPWIRLLRVDEESEGLYS